MFLTKKLFLIRNTGRFYPKFPRGLIYNTYKISIVGKIWKETCLKRKISKVSPVSGCLVCMVNYDKITEKID